MSRFNTPEEVQAYADKAAAEDHRRHIEQGHDLNPYCTPGARNDWKKGFNNTPPQTWENAEALQFDTIRQRGAAAARIVRANREATPCANS